MLNLFYNIMGLFLFSIRLPPDYSSLLDRLTQLSTINSRQVNHYFIYGTHQSNVFKCPSPTVYISVFKGEFTKIIEFYTTEHIIITS